VPDTYDLFEQLLPAKWRDVEFPVSRHRMSIAHDLVEHKYWGVDGARVESTGLAPMRFTFTAPLLNTISPGRNERWAALYPNQMRALIAAFQKKDVGPLQTLEFGEVLCKAERMDIDWDAARRAGVDVELSFVETSVADDNSFLTSKTPIEGVSIGAIELDSATVKADLKKLLEDAGLGLPPYLLDDSISLGELMNKVKAVTDYPTLLSYRTAGQINALNYHVDRIQQSAYTSKNAVAWPIIATAERIKAASHLLEEKILSKSQSVAFFTVPHDTTLAGVVRQIPEAKVGDLIKLNPGLMRNPEIPRGTSVRYYRAA